MKEAEQQLVLVEGMKDEPKVSGPSLRECISSEMVGSSSNPRGLPILGDLDLLPFT